ncbi:mitochondrial small ribosomal subunit protein uS17m [Candidatus Dojkabacteria bacterium]|nr:mitochondrial small ribosomal subunit protein uS17m [Candidatus Dojkabacteria bacterium]
MPKTRLIGEVIGSKSQNTVRVRVQSVRAHEKYHKRITVHKTYYADTREPVEVGKSVEIEEMKPISKTKRWRVVRVLDEKEEKK